jgi:hypothetical protein
MNVIALFLTAVAGFGNNSAHIDNPWLPMRPGTVMRYRGVAGRHPTVDVARVTHRTKVVDGVRCVVIDDRVYTAGRLSEKTLDWYAQARDGTVWYFGEDTRELDRQGRTTSTEGSWRSGARGARAGIFMPANPRVGDAFEQEHFAGHAEDHFKVVSLRSRVTVPFRRFGRAMLTREWNPLEPGVIDHKYYARGIGNVAEKTAKGPVETLKLVSISRR